MHRKSCLIPILKHAIIYIFLCKNGFSCIMIPNKVFRNFHQCWQTLSYILLSDPWDRLKTNNNTCCQYIGCIEGHVTLSLRRCELTSLRRHIRRHLSIWRTSTSLLNGDSFVKIKRWRPKGMQEKESVMVVWCRKKNPSLGITVWHHSAKPRDAKQCPSDGFFYPHLTLVKDSFIISLIKTKHGFWA